MSSRSRATRPATLRTSLAVGVICVLGMGAVAGAAIPHDVSVPALTPLASALLPGLSTPSAVGLTDNGLVAGATAIGVDLTLARPDAAGEAAQTRAIETPGSPDYHHYLTPAEFSSRFGVSGATYDKALSFLTAHGLTLVSASAGHDEMRVSGTAAQVEATFSTTLHNFTTARGVHFYANTTAPLLPTSLPVIGVFGLETWHRAHLDSSGVKPRQTSCTAGTCVGDVTPQDMWGTYDQPAAVTGAGQKLAIFGEGAYNYVIKDLVQFETENKLPIHDDAACACAPAGSAAANNVRVVLTDGPSADYTDKGGDGEWQLDTQSSTGMAYNVDELDMYWGSALTDDSTLQTLATFVSDSNGPTQASASYGECEAQVGDPGSIPVPGLPVSDPTGLTYIGNPYESVAYEQSYEKQLGQGIMEGKTLFSSAGDNGSSCGALPVDLNGVSNADGATMVDYPASSPQVVGVGGTVLYTDGGYENTPSTPTQRVDEYGWTDGGGGPDALFPEPSYQEAVGAVDIPCLGNPDGSLDTSGNTCRGVPDISAISGDIVSNGYSIVDDGADSATGGTSLSSPLSLGLWTRIQSGTGGTDGFANLQFYKYCNDFFDVGAIGGADTMPSDNGAEGLYPTDTGWDYVTGLGTMDVTKLITDIKAGTPAQTCTAGTITVPLGRNPGTPSPTSSPTPGASATPTRSASPSPTPTGTATAAPVVPVGSGFHPLGYAGIGSQTVGQATTTLALAGHGGIPGAGVTEVLTQVTIDHASRNASLTTSDGRVLAAATRSATTRTLALLPSGSSLPLRLTAGSAHVSLNAVGYDGPTAGDSFSPARLGRDSATVTPLSTSARDLVVTVSGKSGIPAKALDAAVLLVRITGASKPGTLSVTVKGSSAKLPVTSYAGSRDNTDVVVVAKPDSHGQVHLRLSAGTAKIVVDQLGGYVKGAAAEKLYAMSGPGTRALSGRVSTSQRNLRLAGGGTAVPSGAGQVLAVVTLTNPTATGELLIGGSSEGQVSLTKGVTTTVLLPISLRGESAQVRLSKGSAAISVTEVGYTS